jgi:hypothetical protein
MTALISLVLHGNSLNGTVPEALCNLGTVTITVACAGDLLCTCCACL